MNYIIIIDNNKENGLILQGLLQSEQKNRNLTDYQIGSWSAFTSNQIEDDAIVFCNNIENLYANTDNHFHLIIDLLLTKNEEDNVGRIADMLIASDNNEIIASGIKFANRILENYDDRIRISFMSKWLNLQSNISINNYNGIHENDLWNNKTVQSVFNPITEDHCIINKDLSIPKYNAKTAVEALVNMAFDFN